MQKAETKLTEFVVPGKAIYILKLIELISKYFGEFLLPLFNSTWDSAAVVIKQLVIMIMTMITITITITIMIMIMIMATLQRNGC